jgi:hypothetical protein
MKKFNEKQFSRGITHHTATLAVGIEIVAAFIGLLVFLLFVIGVF